MSPTGDVLMHLCGIRTWSRIRQRGQLAPDPGLGFIHLSTPEQVHLPANRLYRGHRDLVLLHIDPARLHAPLRWERGTETDPAEMVFPHLYGPLPASAVIKVSAYRPGPDGAFPAVSTGAEPSRSDHGWL